MTALVRAYENAYAALREWQFKRWPEDAFVGSYLAALGLGWTMAMNFVLGNVFVALIVQLATGDPVFSQNSELPLPVRIGIPTILGAIVAVNLVFVATGRGDDAWRRFKAHEPNRQRRLSFLSACYVVGSMVLVIVAVGLGLAFA